MLAKAQRTGLITAGKAHRFLEDMRSLDITADDESFGRIFGDVHRLAVECRLSGYDAAYLELAIRKGLPLATLDEDVRKAAGASGKTIAALKSAYAVLPQQPRGSWRRPCPCVEAAESSGTRAASRSTGGRAGHPLA